MIGFINVTNSFSLAAIQALQDKAETLYINDYGTLIFDIDFSVNSVGSYTELMQETQFQNYNGESLHYLNHDGSSMIGDSSTSWESSVSIVDDGTENVLDVFYKAGQVGYGSPVNSGFLQCNALPLTGRTEDVNNPTEITLEYHVKFAGVEGITSDWAYGGKLPGLAGGLIPSGGIDLSDPARVYTIENGFSARMVWQDIWGITGKPTGLRPYIYNIQLDDGGVDTVYGEGGYLNPVTVPTSMFYSADNDTDSFQPEDETWYKITQKIRSNTPSSSNGTCKVYVDGIIMADFVNIKFIADGYDGDYTVDRLCFSSFYGGSTSGWAPTIDSHIRFKDFKIYEKA